MRFVAYVEEVDHGQGHGGPHRHLRCAPLVFSSSLVTVFSLMPLARSGLRARVCARSHPGAY